MRFRKFLGDNVECVAIIVSITSGLVWGVMTDRSSKPTDLSPLTETAKEAAAEASKDFGRHFTRGVVQEIRETMKGAEEKE